MKDLYTVALTIFGEARGEPIEGIVGVASVIRNRMQLQFHGVKNYTDTCIASKQFSCWNPKDPNYPILKDMQKKLESGIPIPDIGFRQCLLVAKGIIDWDLRDNTRGATHYLTSNLYHTNPPAWASSGKVTLALGAHTFLIAD